MRPLLYYAPPSFFSQIARLALTEKGIAYDEKIMIPGPPNFGTYAPNYMRLNPEGTVPTMVVGDEIYADSRKILNIVDTLGDSPKLTSANHTTMESWIDRAYGLSERELAYGAGFIRHIGKFVNRKRIKALKLLAVENPHLAEAYHTKMTDIENFARLSQNSNHVAALANRYDDEMDALNLHLADQDYIAGDAYSLADVVWTVSVARQMLMKRDPFIKRVYLAEWMGRMKMRHSYEAAQIMDHFSIKPMYKMVSSLWRN